MKTGIWIGFRNQTGKRHADSSVDTGTQPLFEMLLDTFKMPKPLAPADTIDVNLILRRWPDRPHHQTEQIQVNQRNATYE